MKELTLVCAALTLLSGFASQALAQAPTLASTIDVYVFPADGQDAALQSKDEIDCYTWAEQNTGSNPFDLSKQQQAQQQQSQAEMAAAQQTAQGSGARGALVGAATGALIGGIANDNAGKGAAWGAATGAVVNRRRGVVQQQSAVQQVQGQQQSQAQVMAVQVENFKKAFSVCLEAKQYLVKY